MSRTLLVSPAALGNGHEASPVQAIEIATSHACLVTEYIAYMEAAGYSTAPAAVGWRTRGAWSFLRRFPQPEAWLDLSLEGQLRCRPSQLAFVHYLFLRHLRSMPAAYILVGHRRMGEMARRLMERETYNRYQAAARRLGYTEPSARRQFEALVCLMAWAGKPMDVLTPDDATAFAQALRTAQLNRVTRGRKPGLRNGLPTSWNTGLTEVSNVLRHMGIFPRQASSPKRRQDFSQRWAETPVEVRASVQRYLQQMALTLRHSTLCQQESRLYLFFSWLARAMPTVVRLDQIQRRHIEAFKEHLRWAAPRHRSHPPPDARLKASTVAGLLMVLENFFHRIAQWQWPEAPRATLIFDGDRPRVGDPHPRFLDDSDAARFLRAAQSHPDLFTRVCGVTLLRTGLRMGEFLDLQADCVVSIGGAYWLHVPLGKLRRDRYVPLHTEVRELFKEWASHLPPQSRSDFLFTEYGRPIGRTRVGNAVSRIARAAGIQRHVTPHQLRHTLATLGINRGMSLESIAALLGHRSLSMTLVYARISNRVVQQEYSAVSQQLELLCGQPSASGLADVPTLPTTAEGQGMRQLRQETQWRLLGNGYCVRPEGVKCEYEDICEACACFVTTRGVLPALYAQKQDAEEKGHEQRARTLAQVIRRTENAPLTIPITPHSARSRSP